MEETKIPNAVKPHWIAFAKEGFIWNSGDNPGFTQASRLEGLEETKIPNAVKPHWIAFAEEGINWNSGANPVWTTSTHCF